MSQKSTRKSATIVDEKEKNQTDSAVKDVKKKVTASADKEKPAADKPTSDKPATDKKDKPTDKKDKPTDKKDKATDKNEKPIDKQSGDKKTEKQNGTAKENGDKKAVEKPAVNKTAEKNAEKSSEKPKEKVSEKKVEEEKEKKDNKEDKNGKAEAKASHMNGHNGASNGSQSALDRDSDSEAMVIDDELFPELAYDDSSDLEGDAPTSEDLRSLTRRSQVKPTRTPETPRPASGKQDIFNEKGDVVLSRTPETPQPATDQDTLVEDENECKETKVLKLKEDPTSIAIERKLRSTDSPKSTEPQKSADANKKSEDNSKENGQKELSKEVVVVLEDCETVQEAESRKPDTNFSKSRVKVSPYRRSIRLADQTTSSIVANYTGNNTTMETDMSDASLSAADECSQLTHSGYKMIRGRRSYKPSSQLNLNLTATRKTHSATEPPLRPTGTVVGRKRKQDEPDVTEVSRDVSEVSRDVTEVTYVTRDVREAAVPAKRSRLLDKFMSPFRRVPSSTPLPARRAAPIVGINTDLPMSVPVSTTSTYDPESLKTAPSTSLGQAVIPPSTAAGDAKRCAIM